MSTPIKSTFTPTAGAPISKELMPGDVALAVRGEQLKTLLGSCVSVILTDPRHTVAAMSHIVHVGTPNASNQSNTAYGSVAMNHMFGMLRARGVNPAMCEAYVFGGGNMFPQIFNARNVGSANANWVLDFLDSQGIFVANQELGGNGYRKVSWTVGLKEPLVETVFAEQGAVHGG
jgi:chemotaxis protein CheD